MANAFDQFDASNQPANPFDQFDSHRPPPATAPSAEHDTSYLGRLSHAIDPGPFIKAIPQGLIGPGEAIYQFGEHAFGLPRPGAWADPLRKYQQETESTWQGLAGETVGNIPTFIAGGELADILGVGSTLARVGASPATRTVISSAAGAPFAQPTQSGNYWTDKGIETGLGAWLGRILGRPVQQAQRNIATKTNEAIAAQNKADADAFKLQQQGSKQAAANALADPNHPINQALAQRKAQIAAKADVPRNTTQGWWDRTLELIGVKDPALTRASPSTGAKVRDVVGGKLNDIMGGMNLDRNDPALMEHLNDIRDETERNLPENEKAGWYHEEPEPPLEGLIVDPTNPSRMLERTTRGVKEREPKPPTGTFYRTVIAPLQGEGPMTGRELTNYVSRIGARAEELAKEAALVPRERRVVLQAQADALRNVEDAIIGHASGSPEQKLALEQARRAYFHWAIGNDAARASNNGVATPKQLINSMTRRLRGEARYEQSLNNPASPYHDTTNWLQWRNEAHTMKIPSAADTRAGVPPSPPAAQPTPPTPRETVAVPDAPNRPQRHIPRGAGQLGLSGLLYALGHPYWATGTAVSGVRDILGHGSGGKEKLIESGVRALLQHFPRTAGRVAVPTVQSAAGNAPATVGPKTRKEAQSAADALEKASKDMFYRFVSPQ